MHIAIIQLGGERTSSNGILQKLKATSQYPNGDYQGLVRPFKRCVALSTTRPFCLGVFTPSAELLSVFRVLLLIVAPLVSWASGTLGGSALQQAYPPRDPSRTRTSPPQTRKNRKEEDHKSSLKMAHQHMHGGCPCVPKSFQSRSFFSVLFGSLQQLGNAAVLILPQAQPTPCCPVSVSRRWPGRFRASREMRV